MLEVTGYDNTGGRIGFHRPGLGGVSDLTDSIGEVDDLTLKTDRDANGSYETTEHVEEFAVDANGYADNTLAYDAAGNLTFDGVYEYVYDGWNRLAELRKAYRDGGGTLQTGATVGEYEYDGRGRRTVRRVKNSAQDGPGYGSIRGDTPPLAARE